MAGECIGNDNDYCIGLYWSPDSGSADNTCRVRYRAAGSQAWKEAMPLWFDGRASDDLPAEHRRQYRGSIVGLVPGTEYEITITAVGYKPFSTVVKLEESLNIGLVLLEKA